ncbi:hypothetical protein HPP92_009987 [Vanilla planifolia]|uniref:Uncharacterized protein n=1 Tax=Vanilla planifolia TaxID=51239 RepID=A0A835R8W3_VANPL|nr:hypothetical protein HPP92_009987 [Vanilla planifolia]
MAVERVERGWVHRLNLVNQVCSNGSIVQQGQHALSNKRECPSVELELGILETSRGRERESFSGSTSRLRGEERWSQFSRRGHMARDCPKVSDMKAANTPTGGGGRRTMVEAVDLWQLQAAPMVGQAGRKAKERSESGNMEKGNGKEQQGDTQQELAQTLVSLLRSIGGTRHMARDCPKVSYMKAANTPTSGGRGSANHGRGRGSMATSGSAAHGLQYNQAKERSESGNMDKGNGSDLMNLVPDGPSFGYGGTNDGRCGGWHTGSL